MLTFVEVNVESRFVTDEMVYSSRLFGPVSDRLVHLFFSVLGVSLVPFDNSFTFHSGETSPALWSKSLESKLIGNGYDAL